MNRFLNGLVCLVLSFLTLASHACASAASSLPTPLPPMSTSSLTPTSSPSPNVLRIPSLPLPTNSGLPNFEDPLALAESGQRLARSRDFSHPELGVLVDSEGTTNIDGLSVIEIEALRLDAENLQRLIQVTQGTNVDLPNVRVFWNGEVGERSRHTVLAFHAGSVFWLRDRANNELSFDPYSRMFDYPEHATSLGYDPQPLPEDVLQGQVKVRWLGQMPIVVVERLQVVTYVFNPENARFLSVEALRESRADPNNKETWPLWARQYFESPRAGSREDDERFDRFLTDARYSHFEHAGQQDPERLRLLLEYLVQGSVLTSVSREDVAGMNQTDMLITLRTMYETDLRENLLPRRHMLWINIIERASGEGNGVMQRSIALSPNEILQIKYDTDAYFEPWHGILPNAPSQDKSYTVYYGFGGSIAGPDYDGSAVFQDLPTDVFGNEINNPPMLLALQYVSGDIAGLVELPGRNGYGLLTRVRNRQGQPFLHIFHLEEEGLDVDYKQKLCMGVPGGGGVQRARVCSSDYEGMVSVYTVRPGLGQRIGDPQPLNRETVLQWLSWPPKYADTEAFEFTPSSYILYMLHPNSHLVIARRVQFDPLEITRNQP